MYVVTPGVVAPAGGAINNAKASDVTNEIAESTAIRIDLVMLAPSVGVSHTLTLASDRF